LGSNEEKKEMFEKTERLRIAQLSLKKSEKDKHNGRIKDRQMKAFERNNQDEKVTMEKKLKDRVKHAQVRRHRSEENKLESRLKDKQRKAFERSNLR
jgi:hypothetical protein